MSHVDAGALAGYNSLQDPHLSGYFTNTRMRRHLRSSGLVTRKGAIVSETTYRLNMARKEHKKHVRDLLAQAIVHKTLDMERNRQVAIKKKLEEIAKIELVKRVRGEPSSWDEMMSKVLMRGSPRRLPSPSRNSFTQTPRSDWSERGRKGDEEVLPYLTPRGGSARSSRSRPSSSVPPGERGRRPRSAPAHKSRDRRRSESPESIIYMDEEGRPISPHTESDSSRRPHSSASSRPGSSRPGSSRPASGYPGSSRPTSSVGGRGQRKKESKYPKGELDDRHLYALDQATLREYTMAQYQMDHGRGPSPYLIPQLPPDQMPAPPRSGSRSMKRNRRRVQHTNSKGRNTQKSRENTGNLMLHRQEPAVKFQEKVQTFCSISMHYFGSSLSLDYERFDPRDEVMIEQQHCGGNTLYVFNEKILPGSDFTFTSRRHRGYPFSLSFYVNGVFDCRLSTCCEYKHASGARLGGRMGHFGVVSIEGAAPCYKCQFSEAQEEKKKDKKKKKKKKKQGDDSDNKDQEDEADKENKKDKDPSVEVPVEDDQGDDYENDFEDGEGDGSDSGSESSGSDRESGNESETQVRGLEEGQELSDLERDDKQKKDAEKDEQNGNENKSKDYGDDFERDSSRSSGSSSSRSSRSSSSSSSRSSSSSSLERTVSPSTRPKSGKQSGKQTWVVRIYTSDLNVAGTDANVYLVAFGRSNDGKFLESGKIKLDNKGNNFESGKMDEFKVQMVDFGQMYKIRIGHDNSGTLPGWHLDRVEMENTGTKNKYQFKCNRWLARDEDDAAIMREIPAEGEVIKKPQPLLKYVVKIYTGKKMGAGTDANVFINLFGEQGDTGDRALKHSKNNRNKFERGDVDEFVIEAVNLMKLKKIRIGHDGSSAGAGWFLDKVVVKQMDNASSETEFKCGRWLDVDEDDGLIVREITAEAQKSKPSNGEAETSEEPKDEAQAVNKMAMAADEKFETSSEASFKSDRSTKSNQSTKSSQSSRSDHSVKSDRSTRSNQSSKSAQSVKSDHSTRSDRSTKSNQSVKSDRSTRSNQSVKSDRSTRSSRSSGSGQSSPMSPPPVAVVKEERDQTPASAVGVPALMYGSNMPDSDRDSSSDSSGSSTETGSDSERTISPPPRYEEPSTTPRGPPPPYKYEVPNPRPPSQMDSSTEQSLDGAAGQRSGSGGEEDRLSQAVAMEMQRVLGDEQGLEETQNAARKDSSDSDSDSSSSSGSSSSGSDSDTDTDTERREKTVDPKKESATETVTESEDQAGGNDPDNIAGGDTPKSTMAAIGASPGTKREGSIQPLLQGKKEIDLSSIYLTRSQVHELCESIRDNGQTESLILRNSNVDNITLGQLAEALSETPASDLRMLNLNCNAVDSAGVDHVLRIVREKPDMEILLIHGNPLGDSGVQHLMQGLIDTHRSQLTPADKLSPRELEVIQDTAHGVVKEVMKEATKEVTNGSSISLDSQNGETDKLISNLKGYTHGGLRLKQLDLGDCQMTDEGAEEVARFLAESTPLATFSMTANKSVSLPAWEKIGKALGKNTSIKTLSLDYNNLGDAGAAVIAEALRENNTIESLDLEGNKIGDEGGRKLVELVNANENLWDVTLFPGNFFSQDIVDEVKHILASRVQGRNYMYN